MEILFWMSFEYLRYVFVYVYICVSFGTVFHVNATYLEKAENMLPLEELCGVMHFWTDV